MKLLYYENIAYFLGEIALLNIFLVTTLNELIFRSTVLREALVLKSLFQEVIQVCSDLLSLFYVAFFLGYGDLQVL